MSRFVGEAFFIGLKEGLKLSLCLFLLLSFFRGAGHDYLRKPLLAGVLAVFLASFAVMNVPVTLAFRDVIVLMIGYVFGIFYLVSLGALFQETGTDLLGPFKQVKEQKAFLIPLVFLLAVFYFAPDMAGSSLYTADLYAMAESRFLVFVAAGAGFLLSLATTMIGVRKIRVDVMRLFGLPQLLLFLALIKLIAGGVQGFAQLSLIPSVQAGLMKLIHDGIHQTFVFLMVPDHPILSVTAWNFIGILFGNTVGLWLSLILLVMPLMLFIHRHFAEAVPVPAEIRSGAPRRTFIKAVRDDRVLRSIPVFLFILFIAGTWFVQRGETSARLYDPKPTPVVAEGESLSIPLQSPGEDLLDGAIHKFAVTVDGEEMRILAMKKPDGTLAICLDACEICPPDGYAQGKEHVVCLYCRTPIPFETLGKPGGCNPIPLSALVTEKAVQIDVPDMVKKWRMMKSGATKEGVRR